MNEHITEDEIEKLVMDVYNGISNHSDIFGEGPDDQFMLAAIHGVTKAFRLPKPVKMLHLREVFDQELTMWSSSPGLPWTQLGYETRGQIRYAPEAIKWIRRFWHRIKCLDDLVPDETTLAFGEAVFALPLIKAYSKYDCPIVYCLKCQTETVHGNFFASIVYKNCDTPIPEWLINDAFGVLSINLNLAKYQNYGTTQEERMENMWFFIQDNFIKTSLNLSKRIRFRPKASIVNGSYFTTLISSIVNCFLLKYVSYRTINSLMSIKVYGSESICGFDHPISPAQIQEVLEPLGFPIDTTKTMVSSRLCDLSFHGHKLRCTM
ncbi:uncharacterized protein [Prorops nasuta]|uniref:uncharacterized protein n=1 Tax=Prorops nasuta TaxID=863751 RepID=UPI0034D01F0D